MKSQVNVIAGRFSRRPPQRRSLEMLDRMTKVVPCRRQEARLSACKAQAGGRRAPRIGADLAAAREKIHAAFPTVADFTRAQLAPMRRAFRKTLAEELAS